MTHRYGQIYDGEWWKLDGRSMKLMCCDCSLVHDISFRINPDNTLSMRFDTNKRATKAARKRYDIEVKRGRDADKR